MQAPQSEDAAAGQRPGVPVGRPQAARVVATEASGSPTSEARSAQKVRFPSFGTFLKVLQGAALSFPAKRERKAPLMLDVLSGPRAPLAQWLG